MPPKSTTNSSGAIPTRASTRNKLAASTSSAPIEKAPTRTTRSTRVVSASSGPSTALGTKAKASGSNGISELITKKLRPLTERNTGGPTTTAPDADSGAAMLAATKKALRPVTAGTKPEDREPIKAYLRVKPDISKVASSSSPYLTLTSETEVEMVPPSSIFSGMTSIRVPNQSSRRQTFAFTKVFAPETTQTDLFGTTTLPLVKDLLNGENGLIFAYGVTNSGKTYTIQGKSGTERSGILPRALDVVFNSIEGHQGGVELDLSNTTEDIAGDDALLKGLLEETEQSQGETKDPTVVPIDTKWEHRVYISYAEIYNNQIFDLLNTASASTEGHMKASSSRSSALNNTSQTNTRGSFLQTSFHSLNPFSWIGNGAGSNGTPLRTGSSRPNLTRGSTITSSNSFTTIARQALPLRSDPAKGGKYIANLAEVSVTTAEDARKVVAMGQVNRRVFGTVANKESSRSHAVFTIRVERIKRDLENETETIDNGRLSIVDLAGSERNKNTQATGDRMDEANKINSSLMVLGQCMRILRNNQKKLSRIQPGARPVRTEIPPYRMSKLTELFQEFFEGRGRAAMIVNVNPYDTGYHENAAVMEFAALASEISTVTTKLAPALSRKLSVTSNGDHESNAATPRASSRPSGEAPQPAIRQVRLSIAGPGGSGTVDTLIEVVEEAEDRGEDDDLSEDEEDDTLISRLFEELEAMRERWIDAEIRCAVVEAETRESVMQEMEERMKEMERLHAQRLNRETEENELKMDLKIEMLSSAGALGSHPMTDDESEAETETEDEDYDRSVIEQSLIGGRADTSSPSPPEVKRGGKRFALSDGPDDLLPSISTLAGSTQSDIFPEAPPLALAVASSLNASRAREDIMSDEDSDGDEDEDVTDDASSDEEEWLPSAKVKHERQSESEGYSPVLGSSLKKAKIENDSESDCAPLSTTRSPARKKENASGIPVKPSAIPRHAVFLSQEDSIDEPAIVPNRKARNEAVGNDAAASGRVYVPDVGEPGAVKKKKRHLGGKAPVLTEDDILEVAAKADSSGSRTTTKGSIRRLDRKSK